MSAPQTPFHDLDEFIAIPRITSLALAPAGDRLVVGVQRLTDGRDRYQNSLWEIDPTGASEPRRLTHSEPGESEPVFAGDGSLLFISKRPAGSGSDEPAEPALWRLPARGEAERIATSPGGLSKPVTAASADAYVVTTSRLPGATEEADAQWRSARREHGVTAIIHDGFPIRRWDHELGPDLPRLLVGHTDAAGPLRDLTPDAGPALLAAEYALAADGGTVVTTWTVREPRGRTRTGLVAIDVKTGERRTIVDEPGIEYSGPVISPDGRLIAAIRQDRGDHQTPGTWTVRVFDLAGGPGRELDLIEEVHPVACAWAPDSATLYVTGDRRGRGAIVAVDLTTGRHRLVASDAVYSHLSVSPDGTALYALRSAIDSPLQPVRLDPHVEDGAPTFLPSPAPTPPLPGRLVEVATAAPDGAELRGWLILPAEADASRPVPLQQWIHGGPFMSYNSWAWRWCPWVFAARGWAVLMPDPALSTGYGKAWIARAWPHRAALVWRDVETVLDHVVARDDIDADRVACLGASFGGYMTNWVAGHTDRFKAIVSHCALWAADQQHATTDLAEWKTRLFGAPAEHPDWYAENSPHEFVDRITTPMLLIHGNRDYRVPYSESLRAFWDLVSRHDGDPATLPHRFLQFTGENHWVLGPSNSRVWYATVLAFLDWHVLGQEWQPPVLA